MEEPPILPGATDAPKHPAATPPPIPVRNTFGRVAAIASLAGPGVAVAINVSTIAARAQLEGETRRWFSLIVGAISCLLILVSLVLAIIALFTTRRFGRQGVFGPALGGLITNLILVMLALLSIPALNKAKARAKASAEAQQAMRELQEESKKELRGEKQAQPLSERLGKAQRAMEGLAAQSGGERARALKASGQYLQRMQQVTKAYSDDLKDLQENRVLDVSRVEDKQQLDGRKEIVRKFMNSNEQFRNFSSNSANIYQEELEKANVSRSTLMNELAAFLNSSGKTRPMVLAIRETDRRIGSAMLGALDLLEEHWGKWTYNSEKARVLFAGTNTLARYNAFMREINAAAAEQKRLQQQLAQAGQAGTQQAGPAKP